MVSLASDAREATPPVIALLHDIGGGSMSSINWVKPQFVSVEDTQLFVRMYMSRRDVADGFGRGVDGVRDVRVLGVVE